MRSLKRAGRVQERQRWIVDLLRMVLLLVLPLLLSACTSGAPQQSSASSTPEQSSASSIPATSASTGVAVASGQRTTRVALVTDVGKINDGSFNQRAYEGLVRARDELGVQVDYLETQQPSDYEPNLERFAADGYDLVIGVGFLLGDAVKLMAARYPDVKFAIIDFSYEQPLPNVKGIVFKEDQAAYMVATLAALLSTSNTIGVVGGNQIPPVERYIKGYENGAKAQKPEIKVLSVYIPSFTDPAQGAEAAASQIAEGADVIAGAGGQTGSGAIQAAARQGAFVIGVDQDEYYTTFKGGSVEGADRLITSGLKRVDNAVFAVIKDVVEGGFDNTVYVGDVGNGGIDYAPAHETAALISAEVQARVEEVKRGLADGTITTGVE